MTSISGSYSGANTSATLSSGDGIWYIYVQAQDEASNESAITTVSVILDNTPPTAVISNAPSGYTNQATTTLTVGGTDATHYKYKVDGDANYGSEIAVSTPITLSGQTDGSHTVYVIARDTLENWQTTATSITWTVDTVVPDIIGLSDDTTPTRTKSWSWAATDTSTPITYRYLIDQSSTATLTEPYGSGTSASQVSGDGTWYLHVQAKDAAGNESAVTTVSAVLDNTAPVATLSGTPASPTNETTASLTVGGADVTHYKYKLDSGSYSSTEIPVAAPISLSSLTDGSHTVEVIGRDSAGNWQLTSAAESVTWTIDTAAPIITGLSDDTNPTRTKSWSWAATDTSTPITYRYLIDQSSTATLTGAYGSGTSAEKASADGTWYLHVQAKDAAGNESAVTTVSVLMDNTAPVATLSGTPASPTNETTASLTVGGADITHYKYKVDSGSYGSETAIAVAISLSDLSDGSHSLDVIGRDSAGNWQEAATSVSWTVDVTAPALNQVTSATESGSYKAGSAINVTLSFSEPISSSGLVVILSSGGSITTQALSTASSCSATYTVGAGENTAALDVTGIAGTITDQAGNSLANPIVGVNLSASKAIVIDTTAPTVAISAPSATLINTGPVIYTVTYSGESLITLSNADISLVKTGNADAVVAVAGAEPHIRTVSLSNITGDGSLAITLGSSTARDDAGNQASAVGPAAAFMVDNTPPRVTSLVRTAPTGSVTNASSLTYTLTLSETVSGLGADNFKVTSSGVTGASLSSISTGPDNSWTVVVGTGSGDGTAGLELVNSTGAADAAGNALSGLPVAGAPCTLDRTAPTVSLSTSVPEPTGAVLIPVDVTFSESVTGFGLTGVAVQNGTAANLSGSGAAYRVEVTPAALGQVRIDVGADVARDEAGNKSQAATQLVRSFIGSSPTISGTVAGQTVKDTETIQPFGGVTIDDADESQALTVVVSPDAAEKGSFTQASMAQSGFVGGSTGSCTFTGKAPEATTAIRSLVYAPTPNRVAPGSTEATTFTISVNDGLHPAVVDRTTTVASLSINDGPVLSPIGDQSVDELTELSFTAKATDAETPSESLVFSLDAGAPDGASITARGLFTWTPTEKQGPAACEVTVRVTDDSTPALSAHQTVHITVNEVNLSPVASPDAYTVPTGGMLTVPAPGVLTNDTDQDGNRIEAVMEEDGEPAHGALVLNADGSFTYIPAFGFIGTDSFTYHVSDGTLGSSAVTVSIQVASVRLLEDFSQGTDQWTMTGLWNAEALSDPCGAAASPFPGVEHVAYYGNDFLCSYTAGSARPAAVKARKIRQSSAGTNSGSLTLKTPVKLPAPAASLTASLSFWSFEQTECNGLCERDKRLVEISTDGGQSWIQLGEGTTEKVWYQPSFDLSPYLGNEILIRFVFDTVDELENDHLGWMVGAILVGTSNEKPIAVDDAYATDEDTVLSAPAPGVLANDADANKDELSVVLDTAPAHGSLELKADGSFTYAPEPDFYGTDSFTYHASDGAIDSDAAVVELTIQAVNDSPQALSQSLATAEDTSIAITLQAGDVEGDELTYVVESPSHGALSGVAPHLTYTPYADYNGPDGFTFSVTDGEASSSVASVDLSITPVNDAPLAIGDSLVTNENEALGGTLKATDADGDALTYEIVTNGSLGTATLTDSRTGAFLYTPNPYLHGQDSITFRATDGKLTSEPARVSVSITEVNLRPTADAGPEQYVSPGKKVILDARNSTDPDPEDRGNLSYKWTQLSGPKVRLSEASQAVVLFTAPKMKAACASLVFQVKVTDPLGRSNKAQCIVNVGTTQASPIADAGHDRTVAPVEVVTLDGSASYDPDGGDEGGLVLYRWSQISGPGVKLSGANEPLATFTAPNPGSDGQAGCCLVFQLTVQDQTGLASSAQVVVNVIASANTAPKAKAGPDKDVKEKKLVSLNGTGSTDVEGPIAAYRWHQLNGPPVVFSDPTSGRTTFTAPAVAQKDEILIFELTVADSEELKARDRCTVRVSSGVNLRPTADAGPEQYVSTGKKVILDARNSSDPDPEDRGSLSFEWTQLSGPKVRLLEAGQAVARFTAPKMKAGCGSLVFQVKVIDPMGRSDVARCIVNVGTTQAAPIADAGQDRTVAPAEVVTLDGSASYDPDGGGLVLYRWSQISGPGVELSRANAPLATFTAPAIARAPGDQGKDSCSLVFELMVKDRAGLASSAQVVVNVTASGNTPPTAEAGPTQASGKKELVTLDGTGSTDAEGPIAAYRWHQLSGPPVVFSDPNAERATFTTPAAVEDHTILVFELSVADAEGLQAQDTCSVEVQVGTTAGNELQ